MRFGFVTCVQLGLKCMEEIYSLGGHLEIALTLPDHRAPSKSGRVYLDRFCEYHGVPLVKPESLNSPDAVEAVRSYAIDWLFVIGWSQIAHAEILAAPRRGILGMHPSLLPEGRGRAAVPWAILQGLSRSGVTLFQLDQGVDTGPIIAQHVLDLASDETATSLYERVAEAHRTLLREVWSELSNDRLHPIPQDPAEGSVWPGRTPEDGRITIEMTPIEVERLVRATTRPYPGAFWDEPNWRMRVWSGRVADVQAPPIDAIELKLRTGSYWATEWEREPLPSG